MAEVILGIGSNQGNRIANLRAAVTEIAALPEVTVRACSTVYRSEALLKRDAPASWNREFYNAAVSVTCMVSPEQLLHAVKTIEEALGRPPEHPVWSPRLIDIDLLSWENRCYDTDTLTLPHRGLLERNFALIPLLELQPYWQHPDYPHLDLHARARWLGPLSVAPFRLSGARLMGVLNLSANSFSGDGIASVDLEAVRAQLLRQVNEGAEIIDIGAVSTHPGAALPDAGAEWAQLQPVLAQLPEWLETPELPLRPLISVDTFREEVVKRCLHYPVDMINDVFGTDKSAIAGHLAGTAVLYGLMHHCGPAGQRYISSQASATQQVLECFLAWREHLISLGLHADQLVFDIGIGFGKHAFQVRELLADLSHFYHYGLHVLIGHSRKASALPTTSGCSATERDFETALLSAELRHHACYLRVHNVALSQRAMVYSDNRCLGQNLDQDKSG